MPCAALPRWLEFIQKNHHCFCDYPNLRDTDQFQSGFCEVHGRQGRLWSQCVISQGSRLQTATENTEHGLQAEETSACAEHVCELWLSAKYHKESMAFREELELSCPGSFAKSLSLVSFVLTSDYIRLKAQMPGTNCSRCICLVARASHKHIKWEIINKDSLCKANLFSLNSHTFLFIYIYLLFILVGG